MKGALTVHLPPEDEPYKLSADESLRMSSTTTTHRELILPNPVEKIPVRPTLPVPITITQWHTSWLEIHRDPAGSITCHLGAEGPDELDHTFHCLKQTFPGLELGPLTTCPFQSIRSKGIEGMYLLRAFPVERRHYWPMRLLKGEDRAALLFHALAAKELRGHEIVLQVLFRHVPYWESGFLVGSYDLFLAEGNHGADRATLAQMHKRKAEPAYHVEIRAAIGGPNLEAARKALCSWLDSWTSVRGNTWWKFRWLDKRHCVKFFNAVVNHDMLRFAAKKARRNISASEFAQVFPVPWWERIPGLSYAGAPKSSRPQSLALHPKGDPAGRGIVVGRIDGEDVCLPEGWHHLAILGKTRSGKSTLALNVATQIIANRPDARVVVLEPTGNLIRELVERLPVRAARDAVEIDPSHTTFEQAGVELDTVPLNLIHLHECRLLKASEFERMS